MLILFVWIVAGFDMLEQEINETLALVQTLNRKIEYLSELKTDLLASGVQLPQNNE